MKVFVIEYEFVIRDQATFQAKDKDDAIRKIKETHNDVRITDVYERRGQS